MKLKELFNVFCISAFLILNGLGYVRAEDNLERVKKPSLLDSDADGVDDAIDLCPATPIGTVVNSHGCPVESINCDYNTSSVSFETVSSEPIGKETRYLLVESSNTKIVQISATKMFTGLVGSKTYMIVAFSYENDGTVTGLVVGSPLNQVSASCGDFSRALSIKVCSPFIESNQCDFSASSITLKKAAEPPVGFITKYLLVNKFGSIVQLAETPTFTNLSGTQSYNAYSISYINDGSISNLGVGSNFSNVTANCYDWSNPLPIKVCICNPTICVPITVVKIKAK